MLARLGGEGLGCCPIEAAFVEEVPDMPKLTGTVGVLKMFFSFRPAVSIDKPHR